MQLECMCIFIYRCVWYDEVIAEFTKWRWVYIDVWGILWISTKLTFLLWDFYLVSLLSVICAGVDVIVLAALITLIVYAVYRSRQKLPVPTEEPDDVPLKELSYTAPGGSNLKPRGTQRGILYKWQLRKRNRLLPEYKKTSATHVIYNNNTNEDWQGSSIFSFKYGH